MKHHIRITFLLFMLCALFVSTAATCNAEEAKAVKASDVWEKVYEYDGPVDGSLIWCGKDVLFVREHDWAKEVGGYVYVNLVTKEQFWITKDVYESIYECGDDGSTAFLLGSSPRGGEDDSGDDGSDASKEAPGGAYYWAYDIKTRRRTYKVIENRSSFNVFPSPVEKKFAVAPTEEDYKDMKNVCNLHLPGWEILCIIPAETKQYGAVRWSNDGSYVIMHDADDLRRVIAYDNTGKKIGLFEIDLGNNKSANRNLGTSWLRNESIVMSDGVYYFRDDGILSRVNVPSGTTDVLPVKVVRNSGRLPAFDISVTNKEVAYRYAGRNEVGGLYVATFDGKTTYQLSETGSGATYSPTGEYVAFFDSNYDGDDRLVVYKRKKQVNKK